MRFVVVLVAVVLIASGLRAEPGREDPQYVLVGRVARHPVAKGDSLQSIGARFGVDQITLAADNGIDRRTGLRVGQELTVDNRHIVPSGATGETIVVNVPQRMLFFRAGDRVFSAPVAVGRRAWPTPISPFTVLVKETDPTWDVPASIAVEALARGQRLPARVLPGPGNPLGRHWLGLSIGSIGIHGTNAPTSIYGAVTHGCIRLHPDDIAVLFGLVAAGTPGRTIYEPILLGGDGGDVYLEVHPDVYRRHGVSALEQARGLALRMGLAERIDWTRAERTIASRDGIARVVTLR